MKVNRRNYRVVDIFWKNVENSFSSFMWDKEKLIAPECRLFFGPGKKTAIVSKV